jgi:hypothetical protein
LETTERNEEWHEQQQQSQASSVTFNSNLSMKLQRHLRNKKTVDGNMTMVAVITLCESLTKYHTISTPSTHNQHNIGFIMNSRDELLRLPTDFIHELPMVCVDK